MSDLFMTKRDSLDNTEEQFDVNEKQIWNVAIAAAGDRSSIAALRSQLPEKWMKIALPFFGHGYEQWENRQSPRETKCHVGHTPIVIYSFACPYAFSTDIAIHFGNAFPGIRAVALSLLKKHDSWTLSTTYFSNGTADNRIRSGNGLPPKILVLAEAELLRTRV